MKKIILMLTLVLGLGLILTACAGGSDDEEGSDDSDGDSDFSVGLVTDVGGVDDKSFNQSAWEGLQAWGDEHDLEEGEDFDYAQSDSSSDYVPNLKSMTRQDYDLIYGIGFKLQDSIEDIAEQYPDKHFAIVDAVADKDNVTSIGFADNESSFLVGAAAALKTNTDKIGFIGGEESDIIESFESGYRAGAKSVNPDIDIDVQYAGGFDKADKGKLIASSMYDEDRDVIFHSSGGTGNGLFNQAKNIKQNDPDREIWAIGVDRDQYDEGEVGDDNITLTSAVKHVDDAVQDVNNDAMEGDFHDGETLDLGLEEGDVGITDTNEEAMEEVMDDVDEWKEKIIDGDVDVPDTKDELDDYLNDL